MQKKVFEKGIKYKKNMKNFFFIAIMFYCYYRNNRELQVLKTWSHDNRKEQFTIGNTQCLTWGKK